MVTWVQDASAQEIRDALVRAQLGARVNIPPPVIAPATPAVVDTTVFAVALPDGVALPFVITAGGLVSNAGSAFVSSGAAAALQIDWGFGNLRTRVLVDLPTAGCTLQIPPCGGCTVVARVQQPPATIRAGWNVQGAPGVVPCPRPALTAPFKTLAPAGTGSFERPALATGYRLYSPAQNLGAVQAPSVQTNNAGATVVSIDTAATPLFYSANNVMRDSFVTLHPLATGVTVTNISGVAVAFTVQWQIGFGAV